MTLTTGRMRCRSVAQAGGAAGEGARGRAGGGVAGVADVAHDLDLEGLPCPEGVTGVDDGAAAPVFVCDVQGAAGGRDAEGGDVRHPGGAVETVLERAASHVRRGADRGRHEVGGEGVLQADVREGAAARVAGREVVHDVLTGPGAQGGRAGRADGGAGGGGGARRDFLAGAAHPTLHGGGVGDDALRVALRGAVQHATTAGERAVHLEGEGELVPVHGAQTDAGRGVRGHEDRVGHGAARGEARTDRLVERGLQGRAGGIGGGEGPAGAGQGVGDREGVGDRGRAVDGHGRERAADLRGGEGGVAGVRQRVVERDAAARGDGFALGAAEAEVHEASHADLPDVVGIGLAGVAHAGALQVELVRGARGAPAGRAGRDRVPHEHRARRVRRQGRQARDGRVARVVAAHRAGGVVEVDPHDAAALRGRVRREGREGDAVRAVAGVRHGVRESARLPRRHRHGLPGRGGGAVGGDAQAVHLLHGHVHHV